jgi:hypothetical protein
MSLSRGFECQYRSIRTRLIFKLIFYETQGTQEPL